jgi:F0F1-type ATP synthase assembly protein I
MGKLLETILAIIALEKDLKDLIEKAKEAIESEKDKKRRKKLAAAFVARDLVAIREILFGVD